MQGVIFDVFRRYFEYKGYEVTYVRNYTDIDDKIVNAAKERQAHPLELAREIMKQCDEDFASLRVRKADFEPKVSDHIEGIISMIKSLIDKEHAYVTEKGNVYFKVRSFKDYGKLSNQNVEHLEHGVRKKVEDDKLDPLDFALWKNADPSEKLWDSPWGHGRPGWHIECSVMSSHFLGDHFDIHGGGGDLVFPHHENEIAQSESAHDGVFVNYWVHNGLLMVGKDKMSKSLNNDVSIRSWLEKYHPEVIRYLILTNHYKSHVQFEPKRYSDANKKVYQTYKALRSLTGITTEVFDTALHQKLMDEFESYMDRDFNTVRVIALLHQIIKEANKFIGQPNKDALLATYKKVISEISEVLGLFNLESEKVIAEMTKLEAKNRSIDVSVVENFVTARAEFRKTANYKEADKITKKLTDMGIRLIDTESGSTWEVVF